MNRVFVLLGCAWGATACGGSSSETPFPQPPLESRLQARHDAVLAAELESTADAEPVTHASATTPSTDSPIVADEPAE